MLPGELVHKIALEDKHGLGVDGAAKLGLALKVDDAAVPDAHCAGNLMRQAELEIPVPRHRQAIDPPDGGTRRPYLDELAVVLFHVELFHKVRTVHAGFERLFQMLGLHQRGLLHGGHRGGFDHHVAHERELERQLALILGHAGTEIHQARPARVG